MELHRKHFVIIIVSLGGAITIAAGLALLQDNHAVAPAVDGRAAIEKQYPEFEDFETQQSFAGHEISETSSGETTYYAYKVLGSGVPIAQATCFKVTKTGTVTKVGTYPGGSENTGEFTDIDPMTCHGVTTP